MASSPTKSGYNRYIYFVTTGAWFHYKRLYLRTNPAKPLSVTIGMQHAAQFGGTQAIYDKGVQTAENKSPVKLKDFWDVFIPRRDGSGSQPGDQAYYNGNHLGAWDLQVRYRLPQGQQLTFYLQSPWEDGSGIGKLNGWDGVWGLRYQSASPIGWLTEASAEYIDFSNMSGPMHWAPGDHPGTAIPDQATGADDYYNNYFYNGWMNNGMGLGSPWSRRPSITPSATCASPTTVSAASTSEPRAGPTLAGDGACSPATSAPWEHPFCPASKRPTHILSSSRPATPSAAFRA